MRAGAPSSVHSATSLPDLSPLPPRAENRVKVQEAWATGLCAVQQRESVSGNNNTALQIGPGANDGVSRVVFVTSANKWRREYRFRAGPVLRRNGGYLIRGTERSDLSPSATRSLGRVLFSFLFSREVTFTRRRV